MQQRKPDIIKQPIPLILGTFAVAVALLVARAVRAPLPCEAEVAGVLSSVGVWFDGLFSPLWSVVFAVLMTVASAVVFTRIISRYSILLFTTPIAASSAIIAEIVAALVLPGTTIISRPTEHTQVIASNFSSVSAPHCAAAIMPASSLTGINAPERPPT